MADCVLPDSPVLSTVDLKKRKGQQKPPHPSCIGLLLLSPPSSLSSSPQHRELLRPIHCSAGGERRRRGKAREEGVFQAIVHVQEVWPQPQCQMYFSCLSGSLALYASFSPSLTACTPTELSQWSALQTGQGDRMDCLASGYRRSQSLRRRVSSGR